MKSHAKIREEFKWGSFGMHGNEQRTDRLLKDIADSHLANLIPFIQRYSEHYPEEILNTFQNELVYREEHGIIVPDYGKKAKTLTRKNRFK